MFRRARRGIVRLRLQIDLIGPAIRRRVPRGGAMASGTVKWFIPARGFGVRFDAGAFSKGRARGGEP